MRYCIKDLSTGSGNVIDIGCVRLCHHYMKLQNVGV